MLDAMLEFIKIALFIIPVLGVVVIVHELGHYLAGRWFGAAAESFSIGFGQSLFEIKDKRGTRWRVNALPFGGFVSFIQKDENGNFLDPRHKELVGVPLKEVSKFGRAVIYAGGPFANFVLSAILFATMAFVNGEEVHELVVQEVSAEPAISAGFEPGDVIKAINGTQVTSQGQFVEKIALSSNTELAITVSRNSIQKDVLVTPIRREVDINGQKSSLGQIGVKYRPVVTDVIKHSPFSAMAHGIDQTGERLVMTANVLGRIVTGKESVNLLSGPVAIGDTTRRIVDQTMSIEQVPLADRLRALFWQFIFLSSLVSVGVGFINLLPLPVLDGGHLAMLAYEAVTGSEVPEQVQGAIMMGGFALIVGLFVVITGGDIVETGLLTGQG